MFFGRKPCPRQGSAKTNSSAKSPLPPLPPRNVPRPAHLRSLPGIIASLAIRLSTHSCSANTVSSFSTRFSTAPSLASSVSSRPTYTAPSIHSFFPRPFYSPPPPPLLPLSRSQSVLTLLNFLPLTPNPILSPWRWPKRQAAWLPSSNFPTRRSIKMSRSFCARWVRLLPLLRFPPFRLPSFLDHSSNLIAVPFTILFSFVCPRLAAALHSSHNF